MVDKGSVAVAKREGTRSRVPAVVKQSAGQTVVCIRQEDSLEVRNAYVCVGAILHHHTLLYTLTLLTSLSLTQQYHIQPYHWLMLMLSHVNLVRSDLYRITPYLRARVWIVIHKCSETDYRLYIYITRLNIE